MFTKYSQNKHWGNKKVNRKSYWNPGPASERSKWFCEQLKKYDFHSICEVGMMAGRNLRHIREYFPNVEINAFDINQKAVEFAKKNLPESNIWHMDIHDVTKCKQKFDIVFTSGVLIHLLPETILSALKNLISKYIEKLLGGSHLIKCRLMLLSAFTIDKLSKAGLEP